MRALLPLLCLLAGGMLHAAPPEATRARFRTLGVNEGLPHSSVYALRQDREGFIWMGTPEGLVRYDGLLPKTFQPAAVPPGADPVFIRDGLFSDARGDLWMTTGVGLAAYEALTGTMGYRYMQEGSGLASTGLDRFGRFWVLDVKGSVICYNSISNVVARYPFPALTDVPRPLIRTYDGIARWWLALDTSGTIFRANMHSGDTGRLQMPWRVRSVSYNDSILWCTHDGVTEAVHPRTGKPLGFVLPHPKGTSPAGNRVVRDNNGCYWLGTNTTGLLHYNARGELLNWYRAGNPDNESLPADYVTALLIDREGMLWVGTDGGGVAVTDPAPPLFSKLSAAKQLDRTLFITSIGSEASGSALVGTLDGELFRVGRAGSGIEKVDAPLQPGWVYSAWEDGQRRLWVSHRGGLSVRESDRWHNVRMLIEEERYSENLAVTRWARTKSLGILGASNYGLLQVRKEAGVWIAKPLATRGPVSYSISELLPDIHRSGSFWVGGTGGFWRLQLTSSGITVQDSFYHEHRVTSMHWLKSVPGILAMGTERGLLFFNPVNHIQRLLTKSDGLSNDHIYGVLEDERGTLWASTNGGLFALDLKTARLRTFTHKDGLQSNEFNTGAYCAATDGYFYFGGVNGVNWFHPGQVAAPKTGPTVLLSDPLAGDSLLPPAALWGATFQVAQGLPLSIAAAPAEYRRPDATSIQYLLEPHGGGAWITRTPGTIRFAALAPGDYVLRVRALGMHKVPGPERALRFSVVAPLWARPLFWATLALLGTGLLAVASYAFHQVRVARAVEALKRQQALEAERNRISQDLHDEIGSAITQISLLSQLPHNDAEEAAQTWQEVGSTARKVAQSMSEIVWTLHSRHDSLEGLLAYLREGIREFLDPLPTQYAIRFPTDIPPLRVSGLQRRALLLASKEALANAVKHGAASLIVVEAHLDGNTLSLSIVDDGPGFDVEQTLRGSGYGNGLPNIQRRMEEAGGTVDWVRTTAGMKVTFATPLADLAFFSHS